MARRVVCSCGHLTAEGVERRSQADVLVQLGCDHAQGFLFSPAVPAADLEALDGLVSPST